MALLFGLTSVTAGDLLQEAHKIGGLAGKLADRFRDIVTGDDPRGIERAVGLLKALSEAMASVKAEGGKALLKEVFGFTLLQRHPSVDKKARRSRGERKTEARVRFLINIRKVVAKRVAVTAGRNLLQEVFEFSTLVSAKRAKQVFRITARKGINIPEVLGSDRTKVIHSLAPISQLNSKRVEKENACALAGRKAYQNAILAGLQPYQARKNERLAKSAAEKHWAEEQKLHKAQNRIAQPISKGFNPYRWVSASTDFAAVALAAARTRYLSWQEERLDGSRHDAPKHLKVVWVRETLATVRELLREVGDILTVQVRNALADLLVHARQVWDVNTRHTLCREVLALRVWG